MSNLSNFFSTLIIILPLSLITGPAIPDLTITFSIIFLFFFLFYKKEIKELFKFNWFKYSIYFWIYLVISSLFGYNVYKSFPESLIFLRFLFIPLLIYFFIFNNISKINYLFITIFISVIFVIFDCLYQFFKYNSESGFGADIFGYIPDFAPFNRLTGPFKDLVPGAYISKFCFLGLVFLHLYIKKIEVKQSIIILYLAVCGYITYISGERMAFATFGLGLTIYVLLNRNFNRLILSSTIILMFIFIAITYVFHPAYNDYIIKESSSVELGLIVEKEFKCSEKSKEICTKKVNFQPSFISVINNFRESAYGEIYALSFNMYKDNKIFGIGLNNFKYLCEDKEHYGKQLKNIKCVTHPHNYYIQWLTETGPLGLIGFLFYLASIIIYILKNNSNYELKLISIIVFTILFWPIMSTGSLTKNWLGVSTFFILGIIIFLHKINIKN